MKKLFFAAFATLALAACNKELGPEYTVAPVVTSVVSMPIAPTTADDITVTAKVTSQYGLTLIWVYYWYGDDATKAQASKPYYGKGESETSVSFKGTIPKQKTAGKLHFVVAAQTPFSVVGASEIKDITITEAPVPLPDPEE